MNGRETNAARRATFGGTLLLCTMFGAAGRGGAQEWGSAGGGTAQRVAPAQGINPAPGIAPARSRRPRPTLSPYLDLLRTDSGVLPPYHAFVVPRRRIEQQQTRQWQAIGHLQRRSQTGTSAGGQEPLPTGGGGRFQTYLHYYPMGLRP